MPTCKECLDSLYPDDPRVKSGRYLLSGCDYCSKPDYYRQLENQPAPESVIIHRHSDMSKQDWDLLQQTARRAEHLEKKLNQLLEKRKPRGDY